MTASITHGRALRYAGGSARRLLHHHPGHSPVFGVAVSPAKDESDCADVGEIWRKVAE